MRAFWTKFRGLPTWAQVAIPLVIVVLAAASSGGSDDKGAAPGETTTTVQETTTSLPATTTTLASRCEGAAASIADGTIVEGATLSGGQAVSIDQSSRGIPLLDNLVYVVAAEAEGPGFEVAGDVGLWAVSTLDAGGGGSIIAINDVALAVADWAADANPGSPVDARRAEIEASDEADEVIACFG